MRFQPHRKLQGRLSLFSVALEGVKPLLCKKNFSKNFWGVYCEWSWRLCGLLVSVAANKELCAIPEGTAVMFRGGKHPLGVAVG